MPGVGEGKGHLHWCHKTCEFSSFRKDPYCNKFTYMSKRSFADIGATIQWITRQKNNSVSCAIAVRCNAHWRKHKEWKLEDQDYYHVSALCQRSDCMENINDNWYLLISEQQYCSISKTLKIPISYCMLQIETYSFMAQKNYMQN